jgi:hypothetical protein
MNTSNKWRKAALITLLIVSVCGAYTAKLRHSQESSVPIVVEIQPAAPSANSNVSITVTLNAVAASDQEVTIGCTNPYGFSELQPTVTVPAGYASATFSAHTSGSYNYSTDIVTATCNGGSVLDN